MRRDPTPGSARRLTALVTAGGTREPIDDVRFVGNFSRGGFGARIASTLADRGVEVTLLGGADLASRPGALDPRVRFVPFGSVADLRRGLGQEIETGPPDLLFMAAAVSDYSPVPVAGKISSADADTLTLELRKNPKLLASLRQRCGQTTFLVGFKLLSGVSTERLVEVALRQVKDNRLNLCVANDLQQLGDAARRHPVQLVTPEGGAWPLDAPRAEIADRLVDFVLERFHVRWSRSVPSSKPADAADPGLEEARRLLRFAQQANLLPGTDGNVSHRSATSPDRLWVTPRQAPKDEVGPGELLQVEVDLEARQVHYAPLQGAEARKPSIDSSAQGWLYDRIPWLHGLVHFHDALALSDARTERAYPCGTIEEAEEVHRALSLAARRGAWSGGPFLVHLVRHGYLMGLGEGGARRLEQRWAQAQQIWREHMGEVERADHVARASLRPMLRGARIVGVQARFEEASSLFLLPDARGDGTGDRLVQLADERGLTIICADRCEVRDYYIERGFLVLRQEGGLALLQPPSRRDDLRQAASACLLDPVERQVLIGRRLCDPWQGYWAFPGGGLDEGETLVECALRELEEECGLRPPPGAPVRRVAVSVGAPDTSRAYRVVNHCFLTLERQAPRRSEEMEARWVPVEEAVQLRPMAAGTRRVLAQLQEALAGRLEGGWEDTAP